MRIFFDGKVGELKAGQGQQAQLDGRDMNRPADAAANAVGNSVLVAVDVDQRGQHKGHYGQQQRLPGESSAGAKDASLRHPS